MNWWSYNKVATNIPLCVWLVWQRLGSASEATVAGAHHDSTSYDFPANTTPNVGLMQVQRRRRSVQHLNNIESTSLGCWIDCSTHCEQVSRSAPGGRHADQCWCIHFGTSYTDRRFLTYVPFCWSYARSTCICLGPYVALKTFSLSHTLVIGICPDLRRRSFA